MLPGVLSTFPLHSFGAFYLSLAIGASPLLWNRHIAASPHYAYDAFGLVVMITSAASRNIELFDFYSRPGGLVCFGIFLVEGEVSVIHFVFLWNRTEWAIKKKSLLKRICCLSFVIDTPNDDCPIVHNRSKVTAVWRKFQFTHWDPGFSCLG